MQSVKPNSDSTRVIALSKQITLDFKLIEQGRYVRPSKDCFNQLAGYIPDDVCRRSKAAIPLISGLHNTTIAKATLRGWPATTLYHWWVQTRIAHGQGLEGTRAALAIQPPEDGWAFWNCSQGRYQYPYRTQMDFMDLRWYGLFWTVTMPGQETALHKILFSLLGKNFIIGFQRVTLACLPLREAYFLPEFSSTILSMQMMLDYHFVLELWLVHRPVHQRSTENKSTVSKAQLLDSHT